MDWNDDVVDGGEDVVGCRDSSCSGDGLERDSKVEDTFGEVDHFDGANS